MANGDIYRFRLKMMAGSMLIYTYWHWKSIGTLNRAVDLCNLWTGAASAEWSSYSFMLSTSVRLISAQAIKINAPADDSAEVAGAVTLVGKVAGTMLPLNVCGRINWRTAQAGRSRKGCTYIAGISSARHVGGYWSQAQIDNTRSFIDFMLAKYGPTGTGVNWRFGVYSRKLGGYHPNASPAAWTQVRAGDFQPYTVPNEKKLVDRAGFYSPPFI